MSSKVFNVYMKVFVSLCYLLGLIYTLSKSVGGFLASTLN